MAKEYERNLVLTRAVKKGILTEKEARSQLYQIEAKHLDLDHRVSLYHWNMINTQGVK